MNCDNRTQFYKQTTHCNRRTRVSRVPENTNDNDDDDDDETKIIMVNDGGLRTHMFRGPFSFQKSGSEVYRFFFFFCRSIVEEIRKSIRTIISINANVPGTSFESRPNRFLYF